MSGNPDSAVDERALKEERLDVGSSDEGDAVEASPEPDGDMADSMKSALRELAEAVQGLNDRLRDEHERAAHRETVIDRLHDENLSLRSGESARMLDPVVRDLIRLYDELERTAQAWVLRTEITPSEAADAFASLAIETELILSRQGVDRFAAKTGDAFARAEQRAVAAVPADDRTLDGDIARVLRSGFRSGERVVRPAEVQVYRYSAPPEAQKRVKSPNSAAEARKETS